MKALIVNYWLLAPVWSPYASFLLSLALFALFSTRKFLAP